MPNVSPSVCLTEATAPKEHHETFVVSWSTLAPLITTSRRRPNGWPGGLVVCAWRSRETRSTNSWGLGTSSHLIAPPKANQACTVTARFHFAFPKGHLTHCPTTICCCLCSRLLLPLSKHIAKPYRQAVEHHALVAYHFPLTELPIRRPPHAQTSKHSYRSNRCNGSSASWPDRAAAPYRARADSPVRVVHRPRDPAALHPALRPELHHLQLRQPLGPFLLPHRFPCRCRHLRHRGLQRLPCSRQER